MVNLRLLVLKIKTDNKILLRPNFDKLVKLASSYGWRVQSYNSAKAFIKYHKLEESTEKHRAFVYEYNGEIIILYRDNLESELLLFAIAHEIGHLVLQHDENKQGAEIEADEFARLLIGDHTYLKKSVSILAVVLAVILIVKSCGNRSIFVDNNAILFSRAEPSTITETVVPAPESSTFELIHTTAIETSAMNKETEADKTTYIVDPEYAVYISKSGNKYHRIDCYHINVDNCTMMSIEQAVSLGYEPCKTCRPDVEVLQSDESDPIEEFIDESESELSTESETEYVTNATEAETTIEIQPIEINHATLEDFMTIPGVDEKKATAILELRESIHGFQHPYEILYAEGISQEFLASIIDYLYIDRTELTT
ncbi:MAG: helix-hairpin-helix domain-containing protein [Ruminococcus flavefaciens]|nr:helix-hairpin-helix domain-containing protein [Ruminococcus flavefaciens]